MTTEATSEPQNEQVIVSNPEASVQNPTPVEVSQPVEIKTVSPILGIDFGSQKCVIALSLPGGPLLPKIVSNNLSNDETPNIVSFKGKERYIGEEALNQFVSTPKTTITQIKKTIGLKFNDPKLQEELKRLAYSIKNGDHDTPLIEVTYQDGTHQFRPEEIASMVLTNLRTFGNDKVLPEYANLKAESADEGNANGKSTEISKVQLGPLKCVMSVPGNFTENQRNSMIDAAKIAGIELLALVNENTAAALCYALTHPFPPLAEGEPTEDSKKNLLFVEMGQRFFSVQLVELGRASLNVVASAFDDNLGGKDFDNALYDYAVNEFKQKFKLDINSNAKAMCRVQKASERTKEILSTVTLTDMQVESLLEDKDLFLKISRSQLEELSKPLLDRIAAHIKNVLQHVKLTVDQLEFVEIIGGGLRVPFVQENIKNFVNSELIRPSEGGDTPIIKELSFHLDSAHCIAMGAVLYGKVVSGSDYGIEYTVVDPLSTIIDSSINQVDSESGFRMTQSDIERATARNNQLIENDHLIIQTRNAKNSIESYIYAKRGQCSDSSFNQFLSSEQKNSINKTLSDAENWLYDHEEADLSTLQDKMKSLSESVNATSPSLYEHLLKVEEERIKAAKEAEEFAKTYKPMSRDTDAPRTKGEKIEAAKKRKNQGNVLFKDGDYENAVLRYSQGVAYFDQIWDMNDEQKKEVDEIKLSCYLNLSACYMKLKNYEKAKDNGAAALTIDPNNVKALFRRGQALYYLKDFENSKKDLTAAAKIEPNNAEVRKTLKVVSDQVAAQIEKEKKFYGKMFG